MISPSSLWTDGKKICKSTDELFTHLKKYLKAVPAVQEGHKHQQPVTQKLTWQDKHKETA